MKVKVIYTDFKGFSFLQNKAYLECHDRLPQGKKSVWWEKTLKNDFKTLSFDMGNKEVCVIHDMMVGSIGNQKCWSIDQIEKMLEEQGIFYQTYERDDVSRIFI